MKQALTQTNSYDYHLPDELIAKAPTMPKEEARLLVYRRENGSIEHFKFKDLPDLIPQNTAIIFNDTKVIKARLFGTKQSGGAREIMLNQPVGKNGTFSCYIKGRVKSGDIINLKNGINAEVLELFDDGLRVVRLIKNSKYLSTNEVLKATDKIGIIPLPPYLKRDADTDDESWYQSIFAKNKGAVAAPTASLHFSNDLMKKISDKFKTAYITLHVGAGTFKGVECEDIREHTMHHESYFIPESTANIIKSDTPILGVGTTVTRTIEYYARNGLKSGECDLFLNPLNPPIRQNFLLTNFHLPKSTLIMLVAGFVGLEQTKKIYATAIENGYRFYSYGDGMIVL
ncbi:tRNA preQ1(34) S-adenosylmethionine ribosyltransferase-isomerase QueA [Campylobacter sp. 19-13652]|uniref:tRNA preQ1(34) S-adenosylmethionine ribosyltransferase-isomerase QueA n=1 Tax=Campylobacter sp. 19-13652 TaxID=2840180 RepID=UPI001C76B62F|nr:tRNA preQ1(34) S-adenosylmethionine ribosyltransferase-isomerase QueA [Campylobacter sp. 19-13652]BCX79669.1 S-adenosylmethionine:tRNA ribosyltransferase-isomerase [Campylobacter sp. 19-13652]